MSTTHTSTTPSGNPIVNLWATASNGISSMFSTHQNTPPLQHSLETNAPGYAPVSASYAPVSTDYQAREDGGSGISTDSVALDIARNDVHNSIEAPRATAPAYETTSESQPKQKNHALSYAATALNTLVVCGYFAALGLPWFNKTAGISVLMRLGSTQAVPPQMLLLYSAEACLFAFILIAGFLSLAALATNLLAIAQKPVRYVLVVALPLAALAAGAIGTFVWTGVYLSFDLFPGTSSTLTLKAVIFSPRFFPQYMSGWIVGITTLVLNAIQAAISAANRPK